MVSVQDTVKLQETVELIRSESARMKRFISSLPPEALGRPSACELWEVGDVVAHLEWFAETYGGMMERGLRGDLSPSAGYPATPGVLSGWSSEEVYGQAAITRRRSLGQNLFWAFDERYDWLNAMLQGIGPADWDKPCYHSRQIRSVRSFLATIIQELAVHEWDIRSSLESSPSLSVQCLPVLMDRTLSGFGRRPWALPFPASSTSSGPVRYRFELTGVAATRCDVVAEGGKARIEASGAARANLTLAGNSDSFVLLMYGRIKLGSAIAAGRFTAKGDRELVPDFDRWLDGH